MSLVNSLAKVYDSKTLQQKHIPSPTGKPSKRPVEPDKPPGLVFDMMENRIESLSEKLDKLINIQETVLTRLDGMSQDMENLRGDMGQEESQQQEPGADMKGICQEMSSIMSAVNQRTEQQAQKLEGMERLVMGIQQVIAFIGETVKSSRLMEMICNRPPTTKDKPTKSTAKEKPTKSTTKEKAAKLGTREKPIKPAAKEKPIKPTAKDKPVKPAVKGKPVKPAVKDKPVKPAVKDKPVKPAVKDKLVRPGAKEKISKSAVRDKAAKFVAKVKTAKLYTKEKPIKLLIKEKPIKPPTKDKLIKPAAIEKPAKPDDKAKKPRKRWSLIDKGLKSQKKKKPPDNADTISLKKQALLLEEVQKLNQQNAEKSGQLVPPELQDGAAGERVVEGTGDMLDLILGLPPAPVAVVDSEVDEEGSETQEHRKMPEDREACAHEPEETDEEEGERLKADEKVRGEEEEEEGEEEEEEEEEETTETEEISVEGPTETEEQVAATDDTSSEISPVLLESYEDAEEGGAADGEVAAAPSSKRRVTEEDLLKDDHKKSRVEEGEGEEDEEGKSTEPDVKDVSEGVEAEEDSKPAPEEYIIDSSPPPPAPFDHRIVTAKPHQIATYYTINREEILGGGRFGQVHKCVENSSGLTLAAKIIKARTLKEKEVVKNEIQVMNQLDHANLIQLYAAFESRNDIILVMEYVDGGELFDRIIDENYNLTELDTVLFIRQITEGLQYMHQMYILHLDLKPENILCVSRATNKIKIIDFGLARRYKPREKLRVNFGTPELTGLSPFLGEDDNETLNNILACQWNFEEQEFKGGTNSMALSAGVW
ncbi:hypothetical protein JZ751_004130 [Albula glossodonta]|uniref:Protein kinase domain-containing protein n=1 Tax=Albula glossodonta TaxID=121402 RepID=A0A8T2PA58_9TELE|nr:hypothetical protein JZ751_004130 [Albula glossodonta]